MDKIRLFIFDRRNTNLRVKKEANASGVVMDLEDEIQNMLGYPPDEFYVRDTNNYNTAIDLIKDNYQFILFYKLGENNLDINNLIKLNSNTFKIIAYNMGEANFKNVQERIYISELEKILGGIVEQLIVKEDVRNIIFCSEVNSNAIRSLIKKINKNQEFYYNKNFFYDGNELVEIMYKNDNINKIPSINKGFFSKIFR